MKKRYIICFFALVFVVSFAGAQVEKIVNGGFESEDISMWAWQGDGTAAATMERSTVSPITGTASLKVTITTAGSSWWHIQLVQLFGINVKKYTISFKARASSNIAIVAKIQENHSPYRDIASADINLTSTAQTFTFSANNLEVGYDPNAKVTIGLGNSIPAGTVIEIDDISVIETKADGDMVTNGDFEGEDVSMWGFQNSSPGAASLERVTVDPIAGVASGKVTITSAGTAWWHIQLAHLFGYLKDKKYTITLTARASTPITITTKIQMNHSPWETLGEFDQALTTTAQTFSKSFNNYILDDDPNAKLTIGLGLNIPVGTEIWFDNISEIEGKAPPQIKGLKAPGVEKIANGYFEEGTASWGLEQYSGGAATFSVSATTPIQGAGSAYINVTAGGTAGWNVQFRQGLNVVKDKRYYFMYKAKANRNNVVFSAGIQQTGAPYGNLTPFKAETLMTTVKTFVDTSGYMAANDNAKFTMFLGNNGALEVWVDEVTVIENTMAPPLSIVIDGEKDAWYNQLNNPNDGKIMLSHKAYLRDVGSAATWPNSDANISATIWTAWDRDYLYFYLEVNDDIVLCNNPTNWSNDKFEFKIYPDLTQNLTSGVLQTGMSARDANYPGVDPGAVNDVNPPDDMLYFANRQLWVPTFDDFSRAEKDDGYILEFRMPLAAINSQNMAQQLSPGVGGKFGSALNLADNDATERTRMLQWSAGMKDAAWSNPQHHGTVTFLEDNKLKWEAISTLDPTIVNDSAQVWYFNPLVLSAPKNSYLPGEYRLGQNYPNPFNPVTTIEFSVPKKSEVKIVLVNILGQVVKEIVKADYPAGSHEVKLDASKFASGVYFYRMKAGDFTDVKKLVLLK